MAKHVGVKLPEDLITVLKEGKTVAVLATFSEKGLPHTTPIQCLYPKGLESILISIHKEHTGYHNMVWQKKVMICFMDTNNVVYSVLGRAGVVLAPSTVHPLMNVVRIDIIDIKSDRSVLMRVDAGVRWSYTSWDAEQLSINLMKELQELSKTL
jgi:pyridoxamine 5'-phosphate oxidase-like protein